MASGKRAKKPGRAAARRGSKGKVSAGKGDGSLDEYKRKRDFERTREPQGSPRRSRRQRLRFVIQKHAASSLHYDLRLELDGVMRSWAVPKGPSLDPSVKRLAMQVEDHPIEYNTFEGTIPEGEYGGGTVMLWDRGTYTPDEARRGEDNAGAVRRGLESGKLSFTFEGERLNGSFALVRTDSGDKPKWLLIKHRDDTATSNGDITEDVQTSVATGRTLNEIAAENDRVWRSNRAGAAGGEESGRKRSGSGDTLIAPMRPTPLRSMPDEGEWTYEPWLGGTRALAYVTDDTAVIMDERSRDVTREHPDIADELVSLAGRVKKPFVLDGEITPTGTDGDGAPVFHASDLLLEGDDVLMGQPWSKRRPALEALFRRRRVKHVAVQQITSNAASALRSAERSGHPGVVARRTDAPYEPGARSDALLRIAVR